MAVQRATRSQARMFAQLLADLEPEIRRAFYASVTDLQAGVNWNLLLQRLASSDIEGAISALNINEAAWAQYSSAMTAAYAKAGSSTMAQIVQTGVADIGTRFNMTNPRAQEWIRRNVGESITGFTTEQIRSARRVIEAGYSRGEGPRTIAIDLAGRVIGGSREGGVLGLDGPRSQRLENVTVGMRTPEGVQGLVIRQEDGNLKVRYKVNAATASRILSAHEAGTEVPEAQRLISEKQYRNALLQDRAETIAQTETAAAVVGSRQESWEQAASAKGMNKDDVTKTWWHRRGPGGESRITHIEMNQKTVIGLDTPFILSDGSVMQHAHDPAGGARNNVKCGCDCAYALRRRVS